jgi:hypothetical protein
VTTTELLDALWRDYTASTPQADRIRQLLLDRGEIVHNDHVALRTFGVPGIDCAALAKPFEACGWTAREHYRFDEKHLTARYWQHDDPDLPKIFISELVLGEMSPALQTIVRGLVDQLPADFGSRPDLPWAGRSWQLTHAQYAELLKESEYAAWVAAFGFRVNHFTVDVGALASFPDLQALVAFLVEHAFVLNTSGGVIKGSPTERLEQASTVADAVDVVFSDATVRVPSCYYEFARRYTLPSGETFHGFVPTSADKIFESTDVGASIQPQGVIPVNVAK